MEASTVTVHWHDESSPIYAVDFEPQPAAAAAAAAAGGAAPPPAQRLATAGGDNNIRLWSIARPRDAPAAVHYLCTLRKHTQAVNAVRFSPSGDTLASGGDDGALIFWQRSATMVREFGSDDDDARECWVAKSVLRSSNAEIYDLAWSPDSQYVVTGSMDNVARIYTRHGEVHQLRHHTHYVQGVAWDPLGEYVATQSADRSVCVYRVGDGAPSFVGRSTKAAFRRDNAEPSAPAEAAPAAGAVAAADATAPSRPSRRLLYHPETLQSFFRRLAFSPDGSLLVAPSGMSRGDAAPDDDANSVYVYTRAGLAHEPVCHLGGLKKPAIAVAFSPVLYALPKAASSPFRLPHKMVFAVATQDSVVIYDTTRLVPLGYVSNLHYSAITGLVWDRDGQSLVVSSTDGFCSRVVFGEGVFGPSVPQASAPTLASSDATAAPADAAAPLPDAATPLPDTAAAAPTPGAVPSAAVAAADAAAALAAAAATSAAAAQTGSEAPPKKRRVQPTLL
ncbi:Uncharacterized protein ABC855_g4825 [[Candida] zeylanoides]